MLSLFTEIQFADKCKKHLIPVKIDKSYTPGEDWLGFLLGSTQWHDISLKKTPSSLFAPFLKEVKEFAEEAKDEVVIEGSMTC